MRNGARLALWALLWLLGGMLGGCGGGGGGTTGAGTETLSGVAATGAGVTGIITLKDIPTGQIQATHTDDGHYTFNVTGLSGPFLLRARADDGTTTLYGLVRAGSPRGHLNPLTHRMVAHLAAGLAPVPADLAALFDAPAPLRGLTAAELEGARAWVLAQTSPYFRTRLLAHGVNPDKVDPVAGAFSIGRGLDLAFDDVRFFHDEASGMAWERSVASGAIVGTLSFRAGTAAPTGLALTASASVLTAGTSQHLMATLATAAGALPLARGVEWELSDPTLADIDERGVITARTFTGVQSLTVTAHYRTGALHLQDSLVLTLRELPALAGVDMSRLPGRFDLPGTFPLYTTLQVAPTAGGGTLFAYGGSWSLVDPDAETLAAVSIVRSGDVSALKVGYAARDLDVRLRAVQVLNGVETTTERVVTVGRFILQPLRLAMTCPSLLEYGQSLPCTAYVVNNDGSTNAVLPSVEVGSDDAGALATAGNVLTSTWDVRTGSRTVTVTGRAGTLETTASVQLNPRKTRIASLELLGVSEVAEGATATYQVWANWDDGSRTNITSSSTGAFSTSDSAVATFSGTYTYGGLLARYILDQAADKDVTLTATFCRLAGYYSDSCPAGERISVSADVTVRYAPPVLAGLALDSGALASGFVAEGRSHDLTARAIWNKKRIDGSAFSTVVSDGVSWTSSHADAVVSGSQLAVGSAGSEPLVLLAASYSDPGDAANIRSARKVVTLYHAPVNPAPRLAFDYSGYNSSGYGYVHLLGGDGLARPLQVLSGYPYGLEYAKVAAPLPFMANVAQVMFFYNGSGYLADDGSVWYPEQVRATALSAEMRDQLVAQLANGATYVYVPRRVPGISDVTMLAPASVGDSAPGALAALRADGTIAIINVTGGDGPRSYTVTPLTDISGVAKIAGGIALFALRQDGTVWSRGAYAYGLGREATANGTAGVPFGQVRKADGTPLGNIVEITGVSGSGFALDANGVLWAWGSNSSGQLGLGDTVDRTFATPVTSVSGFSQLSPGNLAALRSNGSLWRWNGGSAFFYEPQRVADFTGLRAVSGAFAVAADGGVWWWGAFLNRDAPLHPQPVRPETDSDGAQLVLP